MIIVHIYTYMHTAVHTFKDTNIYAHDTQQVVSDDEMPNDGNSSVRRALHVCLFGLLLCAGLLSLQSPRFRAEYFFSGTRQIPAVENLRENVIA